MNELITALVISALACLVAGMLLSLGYYLGRVHEAKALDEHIETQRMRIHNLTTNGAN